MTVRISITLTWKTFSLVYIKELRGPFDRSLLLTTETEESARESVLDLLDFILTVNKEKYISET
jgi:hypothetical protein